MNFTEAITPGAAVVPVAETMKEIVLKRKFDCAVCGKPVIIQNYLGEQYVTCDCGKIDIILDREILSNFTIEIREVPE